MTKKTLLWILLVALCAVIWSWPSAPLKTPYQSQKDSVNQPLASKAEAPEAVEQVAAPIAEAAAPSAPQIQESSIAEISDFRFWAKSYLAASQDQRAEMLKQGEQLAVTHTQQIAKLIRLDPEQAILNAVPMVIRQDLPESIVSLLEKRVRMNAALIVNGNLPLPGQENDPDFKPYTRVVSTEDNQHWNAFVYGKRGQQRSLASTSINGISVGYDMAVADSPVRQLETGERPVVDGREVVESCPVSKEETVVARTETGALPPVTEETPAFETPTRVVYVCSGGHIQQVAEEYASEEERAHWESRGATLNAGAGSGAPTDPIMAIPGTSTTGQRSLLYIRVTFPDHLIDPQSEAECHDSLRQMADYISQTSYGRCYFTYTVSPLIVLPYPESWYVQHQADGASGDSILRGHAITLARAAGYDNLAYDNEVIRWNGAVGQYGGSAGVGGRNMNLKNNSVGTFCHELGHNLGLWHANYWQTSPPSSIGPGSNGEYGNLFDLLGSSGGLGQFTAYFKNVLSWLPNETHWTVNSPGIYRIYQTDSPIQHPSNRYAIRIKKDTEKDYWAEFRQLHTTNTGFMNGLMLTWDRWGQGNIGGSGGSPGNGSNGGAQLLDMTPGSFGNGITDTRNDSALWVGRTFSDADAKIHITPIAKNATTPPSMDVYVHNGDAPGNTAPTLSIGASATSVATNTNVTLTATASDPNGDTLAYAWVFNDGTYSTNNNAVQTKSWSAAGHYQVLCTASDMKGMRTTRSILVTVGTPTTFTVSGNITGPDSLPLEGVYVASHVPSNSTSHTNSATFRGTWTDSAGNYTLTGLAAGSYTISPNLYPNVFTSSGFANPVTVGPSTTAKNFTSASLPTITINLTDPLANEAASPGTGTVRIERSGSTASDLSVQIYNTNTGTATRNTDYTLSPAPTASTAGGGSGTSEYIIPAGSAFIDITVTPVNDSTAEGTEYASLDFANTSGGYILSGTTAAVVEIADDENNNLPVVKLTQLDNVASETGTETATLKLERNGSTTANLTVNLTMTGTASNGTDYTIPSSVIIPSGSASANVILTPVDDTAQETTETSIVTITTNAAYARDTLSNSQTITIHDNDLPAVSIAATDATLTETPGDKGVFTITRSGGNPYQALTVDYAIAGRAVHGADYRRLDGRATIPAGASTTTVEIYPIDDTVDESTQDIIIQIRSATGYSIGGSGTANMSITDNDGSQVYVKLTNSGVIEPASGSTFAVAYQIIRPVSGSAITVNYAMSGTAINGTDYTTLPGTIAFAAGDTSKTINVAALADTAFEDAESVTLTLLPGTGYTLMASQNPSATGTIVDGDQPTLDVSVADTTTTLTTQLSETSTNLRFIISRDVSTASDLIVNYTMAGTATEGEDYTGTTGTATILANTTSVYITITPVNDTTAEGVESIMMNITPASGTYGLRTPVATMLLGDNDAFASGSVAFAASTSSTNEAAGTHNVVVNVTGSPVGTVSISYRLSAGTATGGGYDYTLATGTLNFPLGTTTQNIPIIIHPDVLAEPSETIVLQLYNPSGGNLGTSTHTVTLGSQSMPEAFTDAATALLANSVTINGHVLPNALATNAWFEYGPTTAYGSSTATQSIGSGTTSVNVSAALSGFAPGGYHFRCVAQNSAGITYGIDQMVSSSNADLANLITSIGTSTPAFDAATLSYSVTVPFGTNSVTVTPTVAQANATVKVDGTTVASGTASAAIAIGSGTTTVNVVVTAQDGVTTKTYTLYVAPAGALTPQIITFAALPATTYGDAPFALTATASSGLPVSYSSSNTSVATVSGSTVTIVGAGSTDITATQAGNSTYDAAPPVIQTLVINQASQTISFGTLAPVLDDAAPFALTATASSGLAVSYASSNTAVATVSGSIVTVVGTGTTTITASQAGNTNHAAAASVPQVLSVGRANPLAVITGSPYTLLIGQSLSLNGSASLPSNNETLTTYEWDLNNDNSFGDVTGTTPAAISYADLTGTWGMVAGPNTIQLKVTDTASKTSTISATVQILVSLTWDANGTTAGQTNGAGAWLGANLWWDGASNQTWPSGASAIFGGPNTAGGAVTLASPTSVDAITFNQFTGTYTLGTTGQALTISGGINKISTSAAVTFSSPITLSAAQTWTNNSTGALTANAALDNGGYTLTLAGNGTTNINSATSIISGAGGITMNATGRFQLGAGAVPVHTYSGTTTLNAGVTMISSNNLGTGNLTMNGGVIETYWNTNFIRPLGSGAGEVQLIGGASGFSLNGNTGMSVILGNNAANEAVWGSAVFNPSIFVLQTSASQASSSVNFQNKLDLNGAYRTIQVAGGTTGAASATISGIIRTSTGTAGLTKTGSGLLILSAANTYNGDTTISGGTLQIGNNTAGALGNGTYNNPISIASGSSLRIFSTANQTLGGVISGGGGLVKAYGGTLTLSNANTYSGKTSITPQTSAGAGTVIVSSFNSVVGGTASSSLGAPTTVSNGTIDFGNTGIQGGATLRYTGSGETTDRVINFLFNGTGATKTIEASGAGLLKFTSAFTGSGSTTNDIVLQGSSNGEITGGLPFTFRNLTKSGANTWTLGGTVGNTGSTTISAGNLALGANNVLSNTAAVTIAAATLNAATFTDTLGTLDVTAASTINLGSGAALAFADSSAIDWTGGTLNLTGTFVPGASLRFGTTSTGLTATQLTKITAAGFGPFFLDANGYLSVDLTPPTLAGNNITDSNGGGSVLTDTLVTYTVTFSEDMNAASVSAADFGNAGISSINIGTVVETSPGVFTIPVTPTSTGTLQLQVNAGAVLTDVAGNALVTTSAIADDTIITVTPPNTAPVANAQSTGTAEDTALPITLTATDGESNPLTYSVISGPSNGTLSGTAPNLTYTPAENYTGADSFTFKANDGALDSAPATVDISVTPVNDAPVATAQSVSTDEDTALPITLSGTDVENSTLTFNIVTPPANGTLSGTAPNLTYTPAANSNGPDSFTFTVNDGLLDSTPVNVVITVTQVNDAPVAAAQSATTAEDTALPITLAGTDVDLDTLTYTIVAQPANGTLSGTAPNVTYTPNANTNGADSFTFKVNDGTVDSAVATVSLTVTPTNDAPVAVAQSATTAEDTALPITLTGTDAENETLTYTIVASPANGTLSGTPPNVTYTPNANHNGADSFTFTVNDGTVDSTLATVSINVTPANDAPIAVAQSATTAEDIALPITLTGTDVDLDSLTYTIVTPLANGTLSGTAPNVTYTPNANTNGSDNFTFIVNDGTVDSALATVSITVTASNDAPVALAQSISTAEDTALPITLAGTDVENSTLSYTIVTPPASGTLNGTAPNVTYTPAADFNGAASFTFIVNDGTDDSAVATVSITVTPVNDAPVASSQSATTAEDTALPITLAGTDVDLDTLSYTIVTAPANGTLSGTAPNVTYTPSANTSGSDSFTFTVNDGTVDSALATVSLTVTASNDAPVAVAQSVTTAEDTALPITLAGTDIENSTLTFTVVTPPTNGTLSGTAPNLTYTPSANSNGADGFTFIVNDGTVDSEPATISINVTPVNDTPVAAAQDLTTAEDTALPITLAGSDIENSALTFTIVTPPTNGTLSGTTPNLSYTPSTNSNGPDSFTFTVNDGTIDSAPATVTLTVTPVNDAPVATAQSVTTAEDTALPITLAGTDVENSTLTYTLVTPPTNGSLSGTAPNVTYTPSVNSNGADSFTFTVNDGLLDSVATTVNITVTPINDAPVATAQSASTAEDTALPITLAGSDVENSTLSYTIVTQPANGTLSGTAPNVTYTPAANFSGPDSFTFTVNDGSLDSAPASVSITVTSDNDAPVAIAQSLTTAEDTALPITLTGSDAENSTLTYSIVAQPASGTLSGTAPNVTYTPAANTNGADSFTFKVNDGTLDSATATISINVTSVNDSPVFTIDPIIAAGASEGVAYTGQTMAGSATDADAGATLTYSKVSGPAWLSVASNGTLTGTPGSGTAGLNAFIVRATDNTSATTDAALQITVTGLPLPWIAGDIGTGMLAGSTTFDAGTFTQAGSGIIGGTADKLRFTYQTLTGDGEIIARISSLQNTGNSSRVGVMIRDTLAPNSKQILMGMTGSGAYRWIRRTATGGSATSTNSSSGTVPNTWIRLVRSGATITAYKSTNGTSWTTVGSTTNTTFAATCYIGLAVGSGGDSTLNTSQFSNLSVTP